MKNLSLTLFQNEEFLILLISCILVTLFLFLIFNYAPLSTKKKRLEIFSVTLVTIIYAILSLWRLGSFSLPETWWQPQENNESIIFEIIEEDPSFDAIYAIGGEGDNNALKKGYQVWFNHLEIYGSNDLKEWTLLTTLNNRSDYLSWIVTKGEWSYRFISLSVPSFRTVVNEIGLKQSGTDQFLTLSLMEYSNKSNSYSPTAIIDEQDIIPVYPTAYDSTYFDEIYHARNAWEIANNQDMYASVHPLLGTTIISLGIKAFGMNPFGWRIMGALFGIFILPLFYLLAKDLFENHTLALFGTSLLAADFMLITTSRIGTLEPFSIFFILLMTFFMVRYCKLSFNDPLKKQLLYLALSGISMGLAISVKWTGVYAAVGLAILFFTHFIKQTLLYHKEKKLGLPSSTSILNYEQRWWKIILWCCIFFILVPLLIYSFSFLPTKVWKGDEWSFINVFNHSVKMFEYHSNLTATHPFQSTWNEWIFNIKPIWYYIGSSENAVHTISCFNNPLISWVGFGSLILTILSVLITKSNQGWTILVCYFAALAPWMLVDRCVFAYHYYPALPFLILAIVYCFSILYKKFPQMKSIALLYITLVWFIYIIFLPVLTGWGTTRSYIQFLEWLPTWSFGG